MKSSELCLQVVVDNELLLRKAAVLLMREVLGGAPHLIDDELEVVAERQVMTITHDESLLAACTFTTQRHAHSRVGTFTYLSLLATAPEERGHGYARLLVENLAEVSREEGDSYVQVVPSHDSTKYYRRLGFIDDTPGSMILEISN